MEERSFHPLDYVAVLRRRKWWFIAPFVVCIIGGAALLMFLPREYKSQAEIGIADPTLSPELLKGVGSLDMRERQRAISQQLLSRTVLERVVREERISPNRDVEDTAARLRAKVEENIEVPNPIGRSRSAGADRRKGSRAFVSATSTARPSGRSASPIGWRRSSSRRTRRRRRSARRTPRRCWASSCATARKS
jgi:uncharacterized protein involved in exopolysaccharide biosynthesis